jgi:DedD protein
MSLLSHFRKRPQDASPDTGDFQSRAEGESTELRSPGARTKRKSTRQVNEPVDPMLPEKKRARRRLVGAVALVLAAIIGLPMILDAEQKPLGEDVVIQIPSRDQAPPATIASSANNAEKRGARVAANAALDPSEEVVNPAPSPAKADAPAIAPSTAPATLTTASVKPDPSAGVGPMKPAHEHIEPKPVAKTDAPPSHKHDAKAASIDTHHPDSARAQSILDGAAAPAKIEKKGGKVIVQVAALASKEKVSELQGKLKAAGISSFTQTVETDSGPRIRVRIGPFGNKEEADAARGKLTRLGLNGTLVPS